MSGKCNFLIFFLASVCYSYNACSCNQYIIQQMQSLIHHLWHTSTPTCLALRCYPWAVIITKVLFLLTRLTTILKKMLKNKCELACWLIYLCYNERASLSHVFKWKLQCWLQWRKYISLIHGVSFCFLIRFKYYKCQVRVLWVHVKCMKKVDEVIISSSSW